MGWYRPKYDYFDDHAQYSGLFVWYVMHCKGLGGKGWLLMTKGGKLAKNWMTWQGSYNETIFEKHLHTNKKQYLRSHYQLLFFRHILQYIKQYYLSSANEKWLGDKKNLIRGWVKQKVAFDDKGRCDLEKSDQRWPWQSQRGLQCYCIVSGPLKASSTNIMRK